MLRLVSFFLVTFAAICGLVPPSLSAQDVSHPELLQLVAEPLPDGSIAQSPARFYSPDNLYEYMDGAADIFVLYGVKTMLHLDAKVRTVDVTVDIFDMGTPSFSCSAFTVVDNASRASGIPFGVSSKSSSSSPVSSAR